LDRLTSETGIADGSHFRRSVASEAVLGTFDIFALSPDRKLILNRPLEAMDANRDCGGQLSEMLRSIMCKGNRDFIVVGYDPPGR
jgi:hypothetical protein